MYGSSSEHPAYRIGMPFFLDVGLLEPWGDANMSCTTNKAASRQKKDTYTKRNRRTTLPQRDVVCVDLFCGAGGLTNGLIASGVRVVAGVDFDEACEHPYTANHEGVAFHKYDVAQLRGTHIKRWFGDGAIRVLAGCAPCQPFSTYSQRYDTVGTERWAMLYHFARLVEEVRPDIVTTENVPSLTQHQVFHDFLATLKRLSYEVWYDIIDCADYGLPQRRRRMVLLASLHGPIRLHKPALLRRKTVADALQGLPVLRHGRTDKSDRLHTASRLSPLNLERIRASKPGGSWRDWPAHLVTKCHRKPAGKSYPSVYGRMRWNEPAPTLTTQFYGFGSGRFGHPSQARALSLREGALLQGFPRNYSFVPENQPIRFKVLGRLIGNAVPVDLGRVIGESILDHASEHVVQCSRTSKRRKELRTSGRARANTAVVA